MSAAKRKMPDKMTVISAFTALTGVFLLTFDFSSLKFNIGDFFALVNALFFSLYLVALRIFTEGTDPVQFTFMQHAASTVAFFGLMLAFENGGTEIRSIDLPVAGVLVLSVLISVSTILFQSKAIKYVRPEKAAVIYTIEPVAAAVLAYFIIGEKMSGFKTVAGSFLILAALLMEAMKKIEITKMAKALKTKQERISDERWSKQTSASIIYMWTKDKKMRSIYRGY